MVWGTTLYGTTASGGTANEEPHYSPEDLSFAGLKSGDAARVRALVQAAERADCAAHLGIVHIEESGSAEPTFHSYRPRRWGRYGADEEKEDTSGGEFEVVEVYDGRHYIAHWRNGRDEPVEFGKIPPAPGELLPVGALDQEKPDQQRLLEASGNEGASFERSYHRAALVLWRRERYAEVLLQAGVAAALPYLQERIAAAEAPTAPPAVRQEAVGLARRLVETWAATPQYGGYRQPAQPNTRDAMLRLLTQLGDAALLEAFIVEVVTPEYNGNQMIEKHGLDLTRVTDRKGSPQTQVCTKTRRTYERRCEEYRKDIAALAQLAELAVQEAAPAAARKKIESARALAAQWSRAD